MVLPLRPSKGGFLRPFGCAVFVREFLMGNAPFGSPSVDPKIGAPQSDIFHFYKKALIQEIAIDRATREEERSAKLEKRAIDPENISKLTQKYLAQIPYKTSSCRYHSFVVYFSNLQRLGWVKESGVEERSSLQDHYPEGQPRRFYRLTKAGRAASEAAWANPQLALYGSK
jgi:hypothetical protein